MMCSPFSSGSWVVFWPGGLRPVTGASGQGAGDPGAGVAVRWPGYHGDAGLRGVLRAEPDTAWPSAAQLHPQAPPPDEECKRGCGGRHGHHHHHPACQLCFIFLLLGFVWLHVLWLHVLLCTFTHTAPWRFCYFVFVLCLIQIEEMCLCIENRAALCNNKKGRITWICEQNKVILQQREERRGEARRGDVKARVLYRYDGRSPTGVQKYTTWTFL